MSYNQRPEWTLDWRASRFLHENELLLEYKSIIYISLKPAPKSPELRLEPMNCTTITVQWQQDSEDTATIQGYKLYYKEEGQQENGPILLGASDLEYTVSGLGEYIKYFLTLLEDSGVKGHLRDLKTLDL